jgi:predicted amidohydrolase YtcJ
VANGWNDLRHHIAHIQVVHPDDLPRFHRLGVVANAQPLWAQDDAAMRDLTVPVLGSRRSGWQYPFGSLHRSGAVLAMGSDWPVTSAAVVEELSVAVRRVAPGGSGEPFLPDERLPLPVALAAFTTGSAYVNGMEDDSGMVTTGRRADLVVLSEDLYVAGDPARASVDITVVGGEVVHER